MQINFVFCKMLYFLLTVDIQHKFFDEKNKIVVDLKNTKQQHILLILKENL